MIWSSFEKLLTEVSTVANCSTFKQNIFNREKPSFIECSTSKKTYVFVLGPWPKVLAIELNVLSEFVEGTNILARTLTATVSPEGGTGALRLTRGEPPESLSFEGESSERPDTRGLIPGCPGIPFKNPVPGRIIWLTGRVGNWRRWRGGVGGLDWTW